MLLWVEVRTVLAISNLYEAHNNKAYLNSPSLPVHKTFLSKRFLYVGKYS